LRTSYCADRNLVGLGAGNEIPRWMDCRPASAGIRRTSPVAGCGERVTRSVVTHLPGSRPCSAPPRNHMPDANKDRLAIQKLKKQLRVDSSTAANNIAATYRKLGNSRRAFHWWRRTAGPQDGDAWLEVGYCLQYRCGTLRNAVAAIRAYRRAIASDHTTEYGCEEAQYHLAVALVDRGVARSRREIRCLLALAGEDGDYPQATELLAQLAEKQPLRICRCRRGLARRLGGKTQCPLHRGAVTRKPV
jgi:tetratricopeptide (TPR) repeat protein